MKAFSLLISLFAILFSSAVFAGGEVVPCVERKVGESYLHTKTDLYGKKTSQLVKVASVESDRFHAVNQDGQTLILDNMLNVYKGADGRSYSPKYYSRAECPFTMGETKTYSDVKFNGSVQGSEINATFTVTVSPEFTTVTVAAGTFKVVKMVSKNSYTWKNRYASGTGAAEYVSYYSPELGVSVKSEISDKPSQGNATKDQLELTEYSVAK